MEGFYVGGCLLCFWGDERRRVAKTKRGRNITLLTTLLHQTTIHQTYHNQLHLLAWLLVNQSYVKVCNPYITPHPPWPNQNERTSPIPIPCPHAPISSNRAPLCSPGSLLCCSERASASFFLGPRSFTSHRATVLHHAHPRASLHGGDSGVSSWRVRGAHLLPTRY